jgi:hypothetical protein
VFAIALGKASSEVYNFAGPGQSRYNFREFVCAYEQSKEHPNMRKVLALLFAVALCVSMSSFAFTQDKPACKSMDKMDKPMDKKDDAKAKHHHKAHKKEKKEEMKKDAPK